MFPKLETRPWLVKHALQPVTASIHSFFWPLPILLHTARPAGSCGIPVQRPCGELSLCTASTAMATLPTVKPAYPRSRWAEEEGWDGSVGRQTAGKPFSQAITMPTTSQPGKGMYTTSQRPPMPLFLVSGTSMGTWFEGTRSTLERVQCLCIHFPRYWLHTNVLLVLLLWSQGVMTSRVVIETWIIPKLWILF